MAQWPEEDVAVGRAHRALVSNTIVFAYVAQVAYVAQIVVPLPSHTRTVIPDWAPHLGLCTQLLGLDPGRNPTRSLLPSTLRYKFLYISLFN